MKTRAEAEAKLSAMPLLRAVTVADRTEAGNPRRAYTFANPRGPGTTTVEIDANPSRRQLEDLANNLPLDDKDRAAALAEMLKENQP